MEKTPVIDTDGTAGYDYRMLDPVSKRAMYVGSAIGIAILLISVSAVAFVLYVYGYHNPITIAVLAISTSAIMAYLLARPSLYYNHYRYRLDDDKVEIRKGIFTLRHILVPIERIHQVEVSKGPIDRHYGLAGIEITTAGGTVTLEYLEEDVAESISARLNENVLRILRQRNRKWIKNVYSATISRW